MWFWRGVTKRTMFIWDKRHCYPNHSITSTVLKTYSLWRDKPPKPTHLSTGTHTHTPRECSWCMQLRKHSIYQQLQSPRLSHLTLQESLKILRPDFVRHSEQRQRALKRNQELHSHQCRAAGSRYPRQEESHRSPHFILSMLCIELQYAIIVSCLTWLFAVDVTKNRPKMSPAEMYRNSKKYAWPHNHCMLSLRVCCAGTGVSCLKCNRKYRSRGGSLMQLQTDYAWNFTSRSANLCICYIYSEHVFLGSKINRLPLVLSF